MIPSVFDRKLNNLMNDLFIAISGGKELSEEGYADDVRIRALKAETALRVLKNELNKGDEPS